MPLFGKNKKDDQQEDQAKKVQETWEDAPPLANENKAQHFVEMRTNAYANKVSSHIIEYYRAVKVNAEKDLWRIIKVDMVNIDDPVNGGYKEDFLKKPNGEVAEASFLQTMSTLAEKELWFKSDKTNLYSSVDLATLYPEDQYPELYKLMCGYYHDLAYYEDVAVAENFGIDDFGNVYRTIDGKIFGAGAFKPVALAKLLGAAESSQNPHNLKIRMEGGLISDIFFSVSQRKADFEDILRVGEALSAMDGFVEQVGAFYLDVQRVLDDKTGLSNITGFANDKEKTKILGDIDALSAYDNFDNCEDIVGRRIPELSSALDNVKDIGVLTQPFEKFVAECELYVHLLDSSLKMAQFEDGLLDRGDANTSIIAEIRESMARAQSKFQELGGTPEQMDRLKSWVADKNKDPIPVWLPRFLTRHYTERTTVMAKLKERNMNVTREAKTLPTRVKPPLSGPNDPKGVTAETNTSNDDVKKETTKSRAKKTRGKSGPT